MRSYAAIFPIGLPALHYQMGVYENLRGNISEATACWQKALDKSIEIDLPYIVVTSANALQGVDPSTLARFKVPYDSVLLKMGVEDVTDAFGG
ncbi:MAG: hypothetical protein ACI82A_003207 [Candidatus Azotimanducaceae bacterium]